MDPYAIGLPAHIGAERRRILGAWPHRARRHETARRRTFQGKPLPYLQQNNTSMGTLRAEADRPAAFASYYLGQPRDSGAVERATIPVEKTRGPNLLVSGTDDHMCRTTVVLAAETIGRVCLGVELEPRFVDVAIRRWEAFSGEEATLLSDGQTFKTVARDRHSSAKG